MVHGHRFRKNNTTVEILKCNCLVLWAPQDKFHPVPLERRPTSLLLHLHNLKQAYLWLYVDSYTYWVLSEHKVIDRLQQLLWGLNPPNFPLQGNTSPEPTRQQIFGTLSWSISVITRSINPWVKNSRSDNAAAETLAEHYIQIKQPSVSSVLRQHSQSQQIAPEMVW